MNIITNKVKFRTRPAVDADANAAINGVNEHEPGSQVISVKPAHAKPGPL